MASLGFWQLRRLEDRRVDNDAVRAASAAPALAIQEHLNGTIPANHTPVTVTGEYIAERSFLVANRTYDTRPGYWLATPVRLSDGRVVIVARGWVPRTWVSGDDLRTIRTPKHVRVTGRTFASVDGGRRGSPSKEMVVISRMDLPVVQQAIGLEVIDVWVQLEQQYSGSGALPIPVPKAVLDDGPHLAYAFQWFFFSIGGVVVYALVLRRRSRPRQPHRA